MADRDPPTAKMQRRKQRPPRPPSRIKIPSRGTNKAYRCASSVGPARERPVPCGFPPTPGDSGENKKGLRFRNPGTCACIVLRRILMIARDWTAGGDTLRRKLCWWPGDLSIKTHGGKRFSVVASWMGNSVPDEVLPPSGRGERSETFSLGGEGYPRGIAKGDAPLAGFLVTLSP